MICGLDRIGVSLTHYSQIRILQKFAMSGHYSAFSAGRDIPNAHSFDASPVVGWNSSKAKSPRPGERRNSKGQTQMIGGNSGFWGKIMFSKLQSLPHLGCIGGK